MRLRFVPCMVLLFIWVGCGGAFTTSDVGPDGGRGGPGGDASTGGAAGSTGTGMGTGGSAGSSGAGGGVVGTGAGGSAMGGSSGAGGSMGTGGAAGRGGGTVDAGVDFTACDGPGQCVAVDTSCCGTCGTPQASNFVGLNTKHVQDYHQEKCPVALPCLACVQGKNPNIAAQCNAGHCQVFDVRTSPEYSACQSITDCHLRAGLGCCTCGGAESGWVSVNQSAEQGISKAMCPPMSVCAGCVPVPPANYAAACISHVCSILMATN